MTSASFILVKVVGVVKRDLRFVTFCFAPNSDEDVFSMLLSAPGKKSLDFLAHVFAIKLDALGQKRVFVMNEVPNFKPIISFTVLQFHSQEKSRKVLSSEFEDSLRNNILERK